ncbi:hypothetical protein EJ08DRAFT_523001 [Tothia fuscella]|uniref:Endonuclease/exonuclease/phosphatase domain-containing protein n=1 Tax=Tothia fuscella TaxID=1048955 RepID=A0A9P4NGR9_9PEZI|nr:hypothetical protein EJ08DRAFT_523001 [Tothia fuscella]
MGWFIRLLSCARRATVRRTFTTPGKGNVPTPRNKSSAPTLVEPCIYQSDVIASEAGWKVIPPGSKDVILWKPLQSNTVLKIVSWNIDFSSPRPAERASAAMAHLQSILGEGAANLVVLLQEVCADPVEQIMQTRWVQKNFIPSGHIPPQITQGGIPRPARYFTMIMTPKGTEIAGAFRLPLTSNMGRDALFVDIAVCSDGQPSDHDDRQVFRLCTTHLESLSEGVALQKQQLQVIANSLKESGETPSIAGLVGGDMNATHDSEHTLHHEVGLEDAWQRRKIDKLDETSKSVDDTGKAHGHTWGYQSNGTRFPPVRFDKFMYTGGIEVSPLAEFESTGETVGRLGIGLRLRNSPEGRSNTWVSDPSGIATGIKVMALQPIRPSEAMPSHNHNNSDNTPGTQNAARFR